MKNIHFTRMQDALDVEIASAHDVHQVGAVLCGTDSYGHDYAIARANYWPEILDKTIGRHDKLGNASTTVHAEIATICAAPATEGATLYVTDLPCPNCAKVIAEARIKNVYIDSHTHNTPLGKKIKHFFELVSLPIFRAANVGVYEMDMKHKEVVAHIERNDSAMVNIQRPALIQPIDVGTVTRERFMAIIEQHKGDQPFAAAMTKSTMGQQRFILTRPQRSVGLSPDAANEIRSIQDKYEPSVQPINRLLLTCARYGLKIENDLIYSSQVPTSREFVNMIGAGYTALIIGDRKKCRDKWGLRALTQLEIFDLFLK